MLREVGSLFDWVTSVSTLFREWVVSGYIVGSLGLGLQTTYPTPRLFSYPTVIRGLWDP